MSVGVVQNVSSNHRADVGAELTSVGKAAVLKLTDEANGQTIRLELRGKIAQQVIDWFGQGEADEA